MSQSLCAYCNQPAIFTKEHLWPAALHSRLVAANKQTSSAFWLSRLQREIPAEPQIRDVCSNCNNVVLSKLDSYICRLFDETLSRIVQRHERVPFVYDYHLLKRWLLKMSYNSARIHDSADRKALEELLPYVLGKEEQLGRSVQLFVQLTYPEDIDRREIDPGCSEGERTLFEPAMNRVGHTLFRAHGIGQKLLRTVHLRSYSFSLAYWRPGGGRAEQADFEAVFTACVRGSKLLRPSQPCIYLDCSGTGAWQSFKESRTTKLVFDGDA